MKLYSILGRYYGTQAEAKAAAKEGDVKFSPEQDTVEVPTDKEGLIGYLNRLSAAIERDPVSEDQFETVVERQDPPVPTGPNYAETSIAIDDAWEQLPLARKAHFAALFCEEAREIIPTLKTSADVDQIVLEERADAADHQRDEDDELFS